VGQRTSKKRGPASTRSAGGDDRAQPSHRLLCGECPKGHKTKVFTSDTELVCDVCENTIKDAVKHHSCLKCQWDCCSGCDGKLIVAGPRRKKPKKAASHGKKKNRTVRGDDEHCGKEIEMPASFWKIKDGTYFKGEIKHTATWAIKGEVMTGYEVQWHTGESELIPFKDIKPYLG